MRSLLVIPFLFIFIFLLIPLAMLIVNSTALGLFGVAGPILAENLTWVSLFTTFNLALTVVFGSFILAASLALILIRYRFPGDTLIRLLLILPIVVPPFVTGIGIRKLFARFGPINLVLIEFEIISQPIDWLGRSGFYGVAMAEILHYYPVILLSILSSASALDYSMISAARVSGASGLRLFREILVPLFIPSILASLTLVFAWSFTELGTPLVFDYRMVLPVKLFTALDDLHTNPRGYVYVLLVLSISLAAGLLARYLLKNRSGLAHAARGAQPYPRICLPVMHGYALAGILVVLALIFLLPQAGVLILSLSGSWNMTLYPEEFTSQNFMHLISHPLVPKSIALSLILSGLTCVLLLIVSSIIAFVGRGRDRLSWIMGTVANLSLIIPGIVLAYAYLEFFRATVLDPRINPLTLLVFAYAMRRLPLMLNTLQSAVSVSSAALEEAARVSGASAAATFRFITFPLARPFIISGMILTFVFTMFEVSESLMLAQQEKFFPISKTMYALLARPDGPGMACALGVIAFVVTIAGLLIAARLSGQKFEDLFRIS